MRMLAEAAELEQLVDSWAEVTAGHATGQRVGRTVVVTAGPGTGTSPRLAAATQRLSPRPAVTLSGSARLHSPAPYDWLAAMLSGRAGRALGGGVTDGPELAGVPPDARAWLAQHPDAPRERYTPDSLLRIAVRVVRELVGDGPAVLRIGDLHALDPASLNLIAELAVAPELPVLLLVSSEVTDAPLPVGCLTRLCGTPGAAAIHLTAPATELTAREAEVLSYLASGMSNKQIARSLGISIRTVTVHVSNLLRKTGSASRTEAALWAIRRQPAALS